MHLAQVRMAVVFFLGAGASVAAGVPATLQMVSRFRDSLQPGSEALASFGQIFERLGKWASAVRTRPLPDVELMMEMLERLSATDEDPLFELVGVVGPKVQRETFEDLRKRLRNFIKKVCIVDESAVKYLEHFAKFLAEERPLNIFTVNYDTTIEQNCNAFKLSYTDGFDLEWNAQAFERLPLDVRLYKIHGSVMWYLSDRGAYLKVPVLTHEDEIDLVSKEKARSLMVYPARKWQASAPMLDILGRLRSALEMADIAVVVGYSFRDDYVRDIFWDAARKNQNLRLILVTPSAMGVYEARLSKYAGEKPSSLSGRVVCLPYRFEMVFPALLDSFVRPYRNGIALERHSTQMEISGNKAEWAPTLAAYALAEDVFSAERVVERVGGIDKLGGSGESAMRLWLANWLRGRAFYARDHLRAFLDSLRAYAPDHEDFLVSYTPAQFLVRFKTDAGTWIGIDGLQSILGMLDSMLRSRLTLMTDAWGSGVREAQSRIAPLLEYVSYWPGGRIDYYDWLFLRVEQVPEEEVTGIDEALKLQQQQHVQERETDLLKRFAAIERPVCTQAWEALQTLTTLDWTAPNPR